MRGFGLVASGRLLRSPLMHAVFLLLLIPFAVSAAALDDHYLAAFGAHPGNALEKAILSTIAPTEAVRSGTPIRHGLKKDWNKLEPATQKTLAKYLAAPTLSGTEQVLTSTAGHFNIHYTTSGTDAPNIAAINSFMGSNFVSSPADWAAQVANSFEGAYSFYFGNAGLGYHPPPNFPGAPYDVYLMSLASQGAYGFTQSDQPATSTSYPNAYTSYIEIDKDFTDSVFTPATFMPLESLQVTSVHEFHHAIQYGYNFYFDIWYAEATSTFMENELYPAVTQLYSYLPGWFNNSTRPINLQQTDRGFNSQAYGRWLFNRYLAEGHSVALIKDVWTRLASTPRPSDGSDIPMLPVLSAAISNVGSSLSIDFFGLAKNLFFRDWSTHLGDLGRIPAISPIATFSNFPVATSTGSLSHYSFAYLRFQPSSTAPNNIRFIFPSLTAGANVIAFKKGTDGSLNVYSLDEATGTISVPSFNSAQTKEVQLLVSNSSATDGVNVSFSTDGVGSVLASGGISGLVKNTTGAGIVGVVVSVYDAGSNAFLRSAVTDASGQYSIGNLIDGSYKIGYNGGTQGYLNQYNNNKGTRSVADVIQVISGNVAIAPAAVLLNGARLSGAVASQAGNPLAGLSVTAYDVSSSFSASSVTASDGSYLFPSLPAGSYKVKFAGVPASNLLSQWWPNQNSSQTATTVSVSNSSGATSVNAVLAPPLPLVPIASTPAAAPAAGGGGGCFIATAAYGSYLHPKVAELRAFRDQYLLTNAPGRIFVVLYYRLSPPVAQVIAQHEWMRAGVRVLLGPVVFAVEHPGVALLLFYLSAWGLVSRLMRRRRRFNKFIHLS